MLYNLLLESVLTLKATKEYTAILRLFPFPLSWLRIQGPLYHLKSYSMLEHARQSIVVPLLLRCQLRKKHIRIYLLNVLKAPTNAIANANLTNYIISQFAVAIRSNSVLISQTVSLHNRHQIADIVYGYRSQLQQLLSALAQLIVVDKRRTLRRASSVASSVALLRAGLVALSKASSYISQIDSRGRGRGRATEQGKKAAVYESYIKKPNMYVAIYYATTADEYRLPVNINVLIREDKHRYVDA